MVQFGQFLFALLSGTVRCSIPHPTQRSNPIRSNPFVAASLRWFICVVQVKAMVQGRDRRPELGYKLALECRRNINYPMKNKNSKYVIINVISNLNIVTSNIKRATISTLS